MATSKSAGAGYDRTTYGLLAAVAGLAITAVSCAASETKPDRSPTEPSQPASLEPGIYAVDSGQKLSSDQLYRQLADRDYVVVGESHDTRWHHTIQRKIFAAMLERREGLVALGMEMFERPYQEALDGYVEGKYGEETMLEKAAWAESWGMDPTLYRPLWKTARKHRVPIAALNVPRKLTRTIAHEGLAGLSPKNRARLPETIDTSFEAQRRYLRDVFAGHGSRAHGKGAGGMRFEYFLQAQATWDETMAKSAVDFVRSRKKVEAIVMVVGRVHARRSFGIPPRIARRLTQGPNGRQVAAVLPYDADEKTSDGPLTLTHLRDQKIADYVWVK